LIEGRTDFTFYPGAVRVPESSSPNIKNKSHTITAYVEVPKQGAEGVLVAAGGVAGGYALYIKAGKPVYEYNWFNERRYKVIGAQLSPGPATIRVDFKYDGGGIGKGGTVTLSVNDKKAGEGRVEKTVPARFSADETFDVGLDTGSPVSADYAPPNKFTGTLKKVNVRLDTSPLSPADEESVRTLNQAAIMSAQ
jgi:hypothetical protein